VQSPPPANTPPKSVLAQTQPRVDACLTPNTRAGTVKVRFVITENGEARDIQVEPRGTTVTPDVQTCVTNMLAATPFARPASHVDEPFSWTFHLASTMPSSVAAQIPFRGEVPPGYHLVTAPRWGLIGGGIGAFLGGYAFSAAIGGLAGKWSGAIPIAGPIAFAVEAWSQSSSGISNFFLNTLLTFATVVETAAQVAGVVMIIVGVKTPVQGLERDTTQPVITFAPGAPGAALGATLSGRF
jgi:hypothetical protein